MKKLVAFMAAGVLASASAYGSISGTARPNYDASYTALSSSTLQGGNKFASLNASLHASLLSKPNLKIKGFPSSFDKKLGTSTFLWAPAGSKTATTATAKSLAYSPLKPELRAETVARGYLGQQASFLRLDRDSVANAKLNSVHDLGRGPIIARFQQYKDGLEVFGRSLNVMMDRNMNAVATSGYFAPSVQTKSKSKVLGAAPATAKPNFSISAETALSNAFADMGGKVSPFAFSAMGKSGNYALYSAGKTTSDYHAFGTQRAKQVYYYNEGSYIPSWFVEVHARTIDNATNDAFGYVISAADGKVLFRKDLIASDTYSYHVFANSAAPFQPEDEPINNNTLDPFTAGPTGDQGRTQGTYNLVALNNSTLLGNTTATVGAKDDPWLPAGATVTTGNNVDAFANLVGGDGFDAGDVRGAISSAGTFDYPYTIDSDPTTATQRQAAIVNQFFVDNWLHDAWYDHGFDEASGNAQTKNFSRGGAEGDPIQAQAQDDSGRNNANMETPSDGGSPIQRMFLWDGPLTGTAAVTISPGVGTVPFGTADFGPHAFTASGAVKVAETGNTNGCAAITTNMTGAVALIDRGSCSFKTKTLHAQTAGAAAVIIANNAAGSTPPGLGDDATITDTINIGTVSVTQDSGAAIKAALAGGAVNANVVVQYQADRDGTMDIQIVAHEFFHYVSNRLVGDANGLSSTQGGGMGEGWSDFDAMLLTVRPEDAAVGGNDKYQGAYPLSAYVTFNQYFGIRRYPYSTDMAINPLTFKHISFGQALPTTAPAAPGTDLTGKAFTDLAGNPIGNAEVHDTGEIWCNTLWEIYVSLLNDPRYSFAQAKSRMQDYIIEGLKMTPNAPTILEARDALLAAAKATDDGDFTLMAKAFAKRGMGVFAIAPDRNDPQNLGVVESYLAIAAGVQVTDAKLDFTTIPTGVLGDSDGDGVLDVGETANLTFTLVNNGTADLATALTATLTATSLGTASANFTIANNGAVTVPPLAIGASETISVPVKLSSATGTAVPVALTLTFPDADSPGNAVEGGTVASGAEFDTVVNYNLQKSSTSDDVSDTQANLGDWALSNNGTSGPGWQLATDDALFGGSLFGSGQYWYGPDNDHPSDITLASPEVDVASDGNLTLAFDHFYYLEVDKVDSDGNLFGFDGGVIEVSTDGGKTWKDAFSSDIGGSVTTGQGYDGFIDAMTADGIFDPSGTVRGARHAGFVYANEDPNNPVLEHVVIDFGDKLKGQKVKVRFREVSDEATGFFGWVVDNIVFGGITNLPFSITVPDANAATKVPVANAGPAQTVQTGATVTLDGSGSSASYSTTAPLTYSWTQTGGPTVSLNGANTVNPTFVPTFADQYSFQLVVTDEFGKSSVPASVSITVGSHGGGDSGGAFGLWLLLPGFALAGLRRRKRS